MPRYQPKNTARVYHRLTRKQNEANPQAPCDWCDNERWGDIFFRVSDAQTGKLLARVCDQCYLSVPGTLMEEVGSCDCGPLSPRDNHKMTCAIYREA